jgi:threonine/homoserine/homoserine lactone efflux protein
LAGYFVLPGQQNFLSKSAEITTPTQRNGLIKAYATTLFLTLTNPATILSFAAIFAGLGLPAPQGII